MLRPTVSPSHDDEAMASLLVVLARVPGPLVTGFLATVGSFVVGFAVMNDCTNNYSCSTSSCGPCSAANALLVGGWVLQGVLFAVTLALWLPRVVRRIRQPTLVALALVVPMVSVLAFAGVFWAADHSYCRPGQDTGGRGDYCNVR